MLFGFEGTFFGICPGQSHPLPLSPKHASHRPGPILLTASLLLSTKNMYRAVATRAILQTTLIEALVFTKKNNTEV